MTCHSGQHIITWGMAALDYSRFPGHLSAK
jgi:hypothetical protein